MDFNFVSSRLVTGGGIINDGDVQVLIQAGVSHIIDCRAEFDDSPLLSKYPQISYLYNGVADDGISKPVSWFEKSLKFALPAIAQPHNKVYVHCAAGVNRGPSTALAILMALGLTSSEAESQIRKYRPSVGLAYANDAEVAIKTLGYV